MPENLRNLSYNLHLSNETGIIESVTHPYPSNSLPLEDFQFLLPCSTNQFVSLALQNDAGEGPNAIINVLFDEFVNGKNVMFYN